MTVSAAAAVLSLIISSPSTVAQSEPVAVDVAVKTRLVSVDVRGRGSCTGDSVHVVVRRKVNCEVRVTVPPGTVMQSRTGDAQSMACHAVKYEQVGNRYKRVDAIVLSDDNPHAFLFEAAHAIVEAARSAPPADRDVQTKVDVLVEVLVKNVFAEAVRRRNELPFRPGDTVEVTADEAPIVRAGRTVASAKKGDEFKVLAVVGKRVRVEVSAEGRRNKRRRGWLSFDHVELAKGASRGEGRPALRRLGELISESDLEVITAVERGF